LIRGLVRYYRPAILYAAALFTVVALIVAAHVLTRPPAPPSIVLITVDSLRADHLGLDGYRRQTSPRIDALARDGVVFERAFTVETLSGPSHASLFTGLYPVTHGVIYNGYRLSEEAVTLAELLRSAGFRTAAYVSDSVLGRDFGFDQGFERFELRQVRTHAKTPKLLNVAARSFHLARHWLRAMRGEKFFLWLHCHQPHFSYNPIPPYDRKFDPEIPDSYPYRNYTKLRTALEEGRLTPTDEARVTALYDGEIAFTDENLGMIFDELRQHPEPVVIVVTSDHGDLLFEPRDPKRVGHGGGHFYEGAMRVPLLIVPPAGFETDVSRVQGLVSSIDVLPTIAEFARVEIPGKIEGRSLKGLLTGTESRGRDAVYAMYLKHDERRTLALRTETHKLIHRAGPDTGELYDLDADPGELHDLAREQPALLQRLTDRVRSWYDERPERLPGAQRSLSPEVEALLRRGGYLDDDHE